MHGYHMPSTLHVSTSHFNILLQAFFSKFFAYVLMISQGKWPRIKIWVNIIYTTHNTEMLKEGGRKSQYLRKCISISSCREFQIYYFDFLSLKWLSLYLSPSSVLQHCIVRLLGFTIFVNYHNILKPGIPSVTFLFNSFFLWFLRQCLTI
jgi:hypothetical protein